MKKISFNFPQKLYSFEEIEKFYNETEQSVLTRFSKDKNSSFEADFNTLSEQEINDLRETLLKELSLTASFQTLACIESVFRTDFIIRCQRRDGDDLSKDFYSIYNPTARAYSYRLKEDIIDVWKKHHSALKPLLDQINEAFSFRNWFAHGRYWNLAEKVNLQKFDFNGVSMIRDTFISNMMPNMRTVEGFGDPKYSWKQ